MIGLIYALAWFSHEDGQYVGAQVRRMSGRPVGSWAWVLSRLALGRGGLGSVSVPFESLTGLDTCIYIYSSKFCDSV